MPENCPICKTVLNGKKPTQNSAFSTYAYDCPRCGKFVFTFSESKLAMKLNYGHDDFKIFVLSHNIRKMQKNDSEVVLDNDLVEKILKGTLPKPAEQENIFIRWVGDNIKAGGDYVRVNGDSILAIIGAIKATEFDFIFQDLKKKGLVMNKTVVGGGGNNILMDVTLTFEGLEYYEKLKREDTDKKQTGHGEGAYGGKNGGSDENQRLSEMDRYDRLCHRFIDFLKNKNGYHEHSFMTQEFDTKKMISNLSIGDHETSELLAIVEFGLNEDKTLNHVEHLEKIIRKKLVKGYVVFPDEAGLGEPFSIIEVNDKFNNRYESILCADFPDYNTLRYTLKKSASMDTDRVIYDIEEASIGTFSISDQPTRHDTLGFDPYTTAIAEFLTNTETIPPLTLSIEGEWGSGKTSFMLQLMEKLKAKNALIVKFSPWRHDKEESVWGAFVLTFVDQLSKSLGWWKTLKANCRLLNLRFDWRSGWLSFVKVCMQIVVYLMIFIGVLLILWNGKIPFIDDKTTKIVLSIAGVFGVVWSVMKKAQDYLGNPLEHDLKKYVQTPDYVSGICFVERFHEDFKKIVNTYAGDRKIYVFIDDLDRCHTPKAAELMQAINLMISDDPSLIFIIGMDREKVAASLAVKHEKLIPYIYKHADSNISPYLNGLEYGYSFLEKFIQLPFSVPHAKESDIENLIPVVTGPVKDGKESLSQQQINVDDMETKALPPIEKKSEENHIKEQKRQLLNLKLAGDSPKIRQIVLMAATILGYNPRRIKHFINLFRLRAYIASETGLFDIPEGKNQFDRLTLEQLGKFVAISISWPSLINDLSQDTELLRGLSRTSEKKLNKESVYVQKWFKDKKLMSFISYFPPESKDLEDVKYSLLYPDIKKLLEISPQVIRGGE